MAGGSQISTLRWEEGSGIWAFKKLKFMGSGFWASKKLKFLSSGISDGGRISDLNSEVGGGIWDLGSGIWDSSDRVKVGASAPTCTSSYIYIYMYIVIVGSDKTGQQPSKGTQISKLLGQPLGQESLGQSLGFN